MTAIAYEATVERRGTGFARLLVIATISFLTLVDLFATQAILPSLARAYSVSPAMMGTAVNLCTAGMAAAGLLVALFNRRIDRRWGVALSLALLAIPTALLALMPDLGTFAALRLIQGVFMSAAFSLTIAYLAENAAPHEVAAALAAYVTGNVASNLFGRLMSAAIADHLGLSANFAIFALLNLAGAVLAFFALRHTSPMQKMAELQGEPAWSFAFRQRHLAASFAIGLQFLTSNAGSGIDLPVRLLVYQDDKGQVWTVYNDFGWVARRHRIKDRSAAFKMASKVIASIVASVSKQDHAKR